jgi:hypothetical protein
LLLFRGRCALPAATTQAADQDATGHWHTSGTVSVERMTC